MRQELVRARIGEAAAVLRSVLELVSLPLSLQFVGLPLSLGQSVPDPVTMREGSKAKGGKAKGEEKGAGM